MVTRVEGKIDGIKVIFTHKGEDIWTVNVPQCLNDAYYFIEITAYDDVGNIAFVTEQKLRFDSSALCWHLEKPEFKCKLKTY